jgi:hypothetical protein
VSYRWMLSGSPRPVQVEALTRSYGKKGWGHWLEMRLGKTATALNEFAQYIQDFDLRYMVVLAPNKFKPDWILAAKKWGLQVPLYEFNSSDEQGLAKFLKSNSHGLIAVNYEALVYKKNYDAIKKACGPQTFLVADESIKLKNPNSATYKNALRLSKECEYKRTLSGKPLTQGAQDLYGQLRFMGELNGWEYALFKVAFCVMGGYMGKEIIGAKNEHRLREILDRCSFTARKIDWIEGFEKPDYSVRRVRLSERQADLYHQMQRDFITFMKNDATVTAEQVITRLIKQMQIASGFVIDDAGMTHNVVEPDKNPRIMAVRSMLEDELDTKLIVFAHYRHSINLLEKALADFNPAVIRGQSGDVIEQKRKFNEDESCRVIIGQIDASKYGHELIGSEKSPCLTTVFYENSYSNDSRSQCEERNQFGDRVRPLSVVDLASTDLDQSIIEALQRKEDVAAAILGYDRATGILPN